MVLALTIILCCVCLPLLIIYYILPILQRYSQLQKDYQNISPLPLSWIPFIGNIPYFDKRKDVFFQMICRLAKQCQDQGKGLFCLWVGPSPRIFLCNGQGLETFINSTKQLKKSFNYKFLEPWLKAGLLTSNGDKWRSRRRLITPSFHDNELLNSYMFIFNEQSLVLAGRLEEYTKQENQAHDLYSYISACTLDIITEAAMGTHPKAQLTDNKNEFVKATARVAETTSKRVFIPLLWPDWLFNRLPIGKEQRKALDIVHGFSRNVIQERLSTWQDDNIIHDVADRKRDRRRVFLDSLIAQMRAEKLTLEDIQEQVDTFVFAGHDTTAAAINYCCYLVGSHPDVQKKIHEEMSNIFGDDEERQCTMEDIQRMTYLDCVIKESLRLFPSAAQFSREVQHDFQYRGQTIRKGTTVIIFTYAIHHDGNVFPDPEKFHPERFAEQDVISKERSPYAYIPFSAGPRNCIGQRFAGLEEKVVLSTLFRRFSFHSTQTVDQLHLAIEVILRPKVPIQMIVKRR